jgi:hypothetical protein
MDPILINTTDYPAAAPTFEERGRPELTVIVKGTFTVRDKAVAVPADDQLPLAAADSLMSEAEQPATRYESDFVPFKPRTDALCVGSAHGPGGQLVQQLQVGFGFDRGIKRILAVGDRFWDATGGAQNVRMTPPKAFTRMPVSYEQAYGGVSLNQAGEPITFPYNPTGKGFVEVGGQLHGVTLPNLERADGPVRRWQDRTAPLAFGPLGRTWTPRLAKAGTYDERWLQDRAPALPDNFDEAYYNCAPPDQQVEGYLKGDEQVHCENMHPEFPRLTFRLPLLRLRGLVERARRELNEIPLNLDTLWLDMEALLLVLVWRGRLAWQDLPEDPRLVIAEEPLRLDSRPTADFVTHLDRSAAEEAAAEAESLEAERESAPEPESP